MSEPALVGIVEAVVGLGQALVAGDHQRGAVAIDTRGRPGYQCGMLFKCPRKWKRLKAIRWSVPVDHLSSKRLEARSIPRVSESRIQPKR